MIVTGTRRYVRNPLVLQVGKVYQTDSGMGGSFDIHYQGKGQGDHYKFRRKRKPGWPGQNYSFTADELYEKVYITPPQEVFFRTEWDKTRSEGKQTDPNEGWFPADVNACNYRVWSWHKEEWHDSGQEFGYATPPSLAFVVADLKRLTWVARDLPASYYDMLKDNDDSGNFEILSGIYPVFRLELIK